MQYFEYCIREPFKLGGKTCMGLQFRSCVRYPAPFPCITETVHFEGLGRGWFWQVLQYFSKNIERNCSQNVRVLVGHIPAAVQLWSNVTAFPVLCSEFTFHFFSFTDFLDTCKKPPMHTYTGLGAISHLRFFGGPPTDFHWVLVAATLPEAYMQCLLGYGGFLHDVRWKWETCCPRKSLHFFRCFSWNCMAETMHSYALLPRKWWPRMLWGSDHPAVRLQGAYHRFRSSYNCPMVEFQFENHSVNPLGPKSCICCCHSFHFKGYITQHLTEVFQIYGFP